MHEEVIFKQMKFIRQRTIAVIDATTEEVAEVIPAGFKNNIRWNLGHIFVAQENLMNSFVGGTPELPASFLEMFSFNTNPGLWKTTPPTLLELKTLLEEQPVRLQEKFSGRLIEKGVKPFKLSEETQFDYLEEVVSFSNWHEGLHQGAITSLKRAQGIEELWTAVAGIKK
ncbi:DinB family protein [Bacillus sp. 2205SS5-2]|uniref:DinB family protein n=1 Tax=Bacillus sp. 2205SS5-2 TaxID=3109031 RepID=UPI0030074F32